MLPQQPMHAPHIHQGQSHNGKMAAGNLDWASDFKQLHITGALHRQVNAPQTSSAPLWAGEFMQHQQRMDNMQPEMYRGMQYSRFPQQNMPFESYMSVQQLDHRQLQEQQHNQIDADVYERAFKEAEFNMIQDLRGSLDQQQEVPLEQQKQENIHDKNKEADDLARTARELLQSLSHERSEKFAKSNFLGLMRKLRDGEVVVEGDKIVETVRPDNVGTETWMEGSYNENSGLHDLHEGP